MVASRAVFNVCWKASRRESGFQYRAVTLLLEACPAFDLGLWDDIQVPLDGIEAEEEGAVREAGGEGGGWAWGGSLSRYHPMLQAS